MKYDFDLVSIKCICCRASAESRCSSEGSGQNRTHDDQSSEAREYVSAYQSIAASRAKGSHTDLGTDSICKHPVASASKAKSKVPFERRRQGDELVSMSGYTGLTIGQLTREVQKKIPCCLNQNIYIRLQVAKTSERNVFTWRDKTLRLIYDGQCR
jgi:hypothetical protein